ncbi:MAG: hypothetical protein K2P80_14830 [Beijerinckiaceae bacterium]|nr:hypothetical protein [Beijerinckiaceae bacterium]
MILDEDLRLAVGRSILSPGQAEALREIARARAAADFEPLEDREKLRFISGFGDIFVVIGIALFLGAAGYFLLSAAGAAALWGGLAALSWGLAELFTRRRRMALPSIVLLLCFALAIFGFIDTLLGMAIGKASAGSFGLTLDSPLAIAGSGLATALLVALHYARFRVPITVAACAAGLVLTVLALLTALAPSTISRLLGWIVLALGLGVFAMAMRFDQSDLTRQTRRTDIAFWLHLLAAPMIVHSFMQIAFGGVGELTVAKAVALIAAFVALAIIALMIDRRAILVSGLVYAGVAFGTVLKETALSNATIPASLLTLGAFILALSSGWQPIRRAVLTLAPPALRRRLPPATLSGTS